MSRGASRRKIAPQDVRSSGRSRLPSGTSTRHRSRSRSASGTYAALVVPIGSQGIAVIGNEGVAPGQAGNARIDGAATAVHQGDLQSGGGQGLRVVSAAGREGGRHLKRDTDA